MFGYWITMSLKNNTKIMGGLLEKNQCPHLIGHFTTSSFAKRSTGQLTPHEIAFLQKKIISVGTNTSNVAEGMRWLSGDEVAQRGCGGSVGMRWLSGDGVAQWG
jgi:hypothetical protein